MPELPVIAIFAESAPVRAYLSDITARAGFESLILDKTPLQAALVLACADVEASIPRLEGQAVLRLGMSGSSENVRSIHSPVRAGELIETVRRMVFARGGLPPRLEIAGHILDTRESLWSGKGESPVRLTEKEVAILCCLKDSKGSSVSRQVLLDAVWAYADGVETHTLETHIYRLRQKIEADPSKPGILLTAEDGYRLAE